MGKGYVFTAQTEIEVNRKVTDFKSSIRRKGFGNRFHQSVVTISPLTGLYRVIIDVCGTPSSEIDNLAKHIQNK